MFSAVVDCGLILSSNILLLLFKKIIIVVSPVHKIWSMLRLMFSVLGGRPSWLCRALSLTLCAGGGPLYITLAARLLALSVPELMTRLCTVNL